MRNNPINWVDPWGLSKWEKVPGHPDWGVRHDQPHHSKDYAHDHYRKRGKEYDRKVNPKTGKQNAHGKKGVDKDVPKDVTDAGKKESKEEKENNKQESRQSNVCQINISKEAKEATFWTTVGVTVFYVIWQGSRVYLPRNAIPF